VVLAEEDTGQYEPHIYIRYEYTLSTHNIQHEYILSLAETSSESNRRYLSTILGRLNKQLNLILSTCQIQCRPATFWSAFVSVASRELSAVSRFRINQHQPQNLLLFSYSLLFSSAHCNCVRLRE